MLNALWELSPSFINMISVNIGHVENGIYTGEYSTVAFCGFVRTMGESDDAMNRFAGKHGLMKDLMSFNEEHKFNGEE